MEIKYRKEIEGLRGLAIIGVLFYHVEFFLSDYKIFSGGFLGVDIFFVISGYLISKIILNELHNKNNLNLKYFYFRRVRRIFPALYLMIIVSIIFGWFYLTPENFQEFSSSIIASIFFYSNYFFFFEGLNYNAESSFLKPLLHTWSLAVEEQFYIIFPIFLVSIWKLKNSFNIIIIISFLVLFALSLLTTFNNVSFSFYSSTSRFWELLAGTLLVCIEKKNLIKNHKNYLSNLGIILIIISYLVFDNQTVHPSYPTLIPVFGTCLIILFINKNQILYSLLTNNIAAKIGIWSYSLYLWHYPIFAIARNRGKALSDYDKLELIILTFVFSIISYYFFEKPLRKLSYNKFKILFASIFTISSIFVIFNLYSIKNNGFEDRVHLILKNLSRENLWEKMSDDKGLCFDRVNSFCHFNNGFSHSILLVGDSHAEVISSNLYEQIQQKYDFISMNRGGCIYLPGVKKTYHISGKEYHNCTIESKLEIEKIINKTKNSFIVIVGNFKEHFDKSSEWNYKVKDNIPIEESFKKSLLNILNNQNNNKVVLVYPVPSLPYDIRKKIMNEVPKSSFKASDFLNKNPYMTSYESYINQNKIVFEIFNSLKHENLIKVYPEEIFCDNVKLKKCFSHKGTKIYYSDSHHLSYEGSKLLNKLILLKIIGKD